MSYLLEAQKCVHPRMVKICPQRHAVCFFCFYFILLYYYDRSSDLCVSQIMRPCCLNACRVVDITLQESLVSYLARQQAVNKTTPPPLSRRPFHGSITKVPTRTHKMHYCVEYYHLDRMRPPAPSHTHAEATVLQPYPVTHPCNYGAHKHRRTGQYSIHLIPLLPFPITLSQCHSPAQPTTHSILKCHP